MKIVHDKATALAFEQERAKANESIKTALVAFARNIEAYAAQPDFFALLIQFFMLYQQYRSLPAGGEVRSPGVAFTDPTMPGARLIAGIYVDRLS